MDWASSSPRFRSRPCACRRKRADARAARPQDHRRAGRDRSGGASRGAFARPTIRWTRSTAAWPQGRAADRHAVRAAAARLAPAGGAGGARRGGGAGARAADPAVGRRARARRLGARRLALSGYRVDGSVAEASVATAIPSRDRQAFAATAGRQGSGARPGIRLRRVHAGSELERAARGGAGQPGRGDRRRGATSRGWSTG